MERLTNEQVELLQKKYERLIDYTAKMRHHQLLYFKYHSSQDRDKANQYAREVDKMLLAEKEARASKQKEIF
jgi:hypothetical protein